MKKNVLVLFLLAVQTSIVKPSGSMVLEDPLALEAAMVELHEEVLLELEGAREGSQSPEVASVSISRSVTQRDLTATVSPTKFIARPESAYTPSPSPKVKLPKSHSVRQFDSSPLRFQVILPAPSPIAVAALSSGLVQQGKPILFSSMSELPPISPRSEALRKNFPSEPACCVLM